MSEEIEPEGHSSHTPETHATERRPEHLCTARKTNGEPCRAFRVRGTTVCRTHGGLAPQVKAKGQQRVKEQKARAEIERWTEKFGRLKGTDKHPLEHLLDELWLSANAVSVLTEQVQELHGVEQTNFEGTREADVIYQLWLEERKQHAKLAEMALRAGVAERQVRVVEQQAEVVVKAMKGVLDELGVGHRPEVPKLLRKHLLSLAEGSEDRDG